MFHNNRTFLAVALGLWVCVLILVGCGSDSNDTNAVSEQEASTTSSASTTDAKSADPIVPSAWKTVSDRPWRLSIPEDWVDDSGFYYPKESVNSKTGAPSIFCVIGTRTIAEGKTAEDELKAMFGSAPLNKSAMTVCNRSGYMVAAKTNVALVFELEASTSFGQKTAIDYINCGAPSSSKFNQYEPIFRRILESANCSAD